MLPVYTISKFVHMGVSASIPDSSGYFPRLGGRLVHTGSSHEAHAKNYTKNTHRTECTSSVAYAVDIAKGSLAALSGGPGTREWKDE
jgi:hypothetical protein